MTHDKKALTEEDDWDDHYMKAHGDPTVNSCKAECPECTVDKQPGSPKAWKWLFGKFKDMQQEIEQQQEKTKDLTQRLEGVISFAKLTDSEFTIHRSASGTHIYGPEKPLECDKKEPLTLYEEWDIDRDESQDDEINDEVRTPESRQLKIGEVCHYCEHITHADGEQEMCDNPKSLFYKKCVKTEGTCFKFESIYKKYPADDSNDWWDYQQYDSAKTPYYGKTGNALFPARDKDNRTFIKDYAMLLEFNAKGKILNEKVIEVLTKGGIQK